MRCARRGRKLWCRTPVVVEAILVVDPVVLTVAGVKVALTVMKRPNEAPVTRLVTTLFSGVLIMTENKITEMQDEKCRRSSRRREA